MTPALSRSATACQAAKNRAKRLATALDLQTVGDDANQWTVYVLGVHSDGRTVWLQIAPSLDGRDSMILRLSLRATAQHALAALSALGRVQGHRRPIVPVMCTV